jgi:hypothetical protein
MFWFKAEPLLVPGGNLCGKGSTWNPKEFYLGPKRVNTRVFLLGTFENIHFLSLTAPGPIYSWTWLKASHCLMAIQPSLRWWTGFPKLHI